MKRNLILIALVIAGTLLYRGNKQPYQRVSSASDKIPNYQHIITPIRSSTRPTYIDPLQKSKSAQLRIKQQKTAERLNCSQN